MGGSSSKVRRPCLWQVTSVLNNIRGAAKRNSVPLWGSVAFPNPSTGTTSTIGLLFASRFTTVCCKRFWKSSPLPCRLPTFADVVNPWVAVCDPQNTSKSKRFTGRARQTMFLNLKTKNNKMKLACESAGEFAKPMLS